MADGEMTAVPSDAVAPAGFVHLHVHTQFSVADATTRISDIVARCKAEGMSAVALTDHDNLYGAVDFYKACKKEGISLQDSQYASNDAVLQLLDRPQIGIFALLDDASKYPRETDVGFLKRCVSTLADTEHFIYPAKTAIRLRSMAQQQFRNSPQRSSSARTRFQVVHGREDPLIPLACGEDTARRAGAPLVVIEGMGHDVTAANSERLAGALIGFARAEA